MRALALLVLAVPFAVALACGGGQPEAASPAGGSTSASASPSMSASPPPAGSTGPAAPASENPLPAFDGLSRGQRFDRMKTVVLPKMAKTFGDYDAKKYADFSCKSCHGPSGKEDPRKFLPKLKMSGDGVQKLMAAKPEMFKFMHEQVEPQMAAAMGEKPFDMATKTGFGCQGCHGIE